MKTAIREIPEDLRHKYRHYNDGRLWGDKVLELPNDKIFYEVVTVMRANPPHINHTTTLQELCKEAVKVKINLGSANKFDKKNPFKIEEREDMVKLALRDYNNYELLRLPDFDTDEEWVNYLFKNNKPFTEVLTNNDYDLRIYQENQKEKLKDGTVHNLYDIIHPIDIINQDRMIYVTDGILQNGAIFKPVRKPLYVSGTFMRAGMVNNWNWQDFIDPKVAEYIVKNNLVDRIKKLCPELKGIPLEKLDDGR